MAAGAGRGARACRAAAAAPPAGRGGVGGEGGRGSSRSGSGSTSSSASGQRRRPHGPAARLALAALVLAAAAAAPRAASAMAVQYCPDGRSMETGLCYPRCPLGSVGLGCTCWARGATTWRGCGVAPRTCEARSFRAPLAPAPAAAAASASAPGRGAFSLVLSADPQLFRNYTRYDDRRGAEAINRNLVRAVNSVTGLREWPGDVGGGPVGEPRAAVVLGDLTEFYMERQQDAFRHFYDPSYPRSGPDERVRFPTWLMLGVRRAWGVTRAGGEKAAGVRRRQACWPPAARADAQPRAAAPDCAGQSGGPDAPPRPDARARPSLPPCPPPTHTHSPPEPRLCQQRRPLQRKDGGQALLRQVGGLHDALRARTGLPDRPLRGPAKVKHHQLPRALHGVRV
jgi:hypothetical protein